MRTSHALTILSLPLLAAAGCVAPPGDATSETISIGPGPIAVGPPPAGGNFTVHALGRMCIDVGGQAYWAPGAPVMIYWCNGTIAQQLDVQEVAGGDHDVTLHLGNGVDNNYCIGARGGRAVAGAALEIQTCNGSDAQRFALDGDSIMAGTRPIILPGLTPSLSVVPHITRALVVTPQNDVTNARTPLVLGPRRLTENEYFRFVATDGSSRKPHSGFVTPTTSTDLQSSLFNATWGTVVEVADGAVFDMAGMLETNIPAGVTLRGNRKFAGLGGLITDSQNEDEALFYIESSDVRLTGLRIVGATWGLDKTSSSLAIHVNDDSKTTVTIDHNEIAQFTSDGIELKGPPPNVHQLSCPSTPPPRPRPTPVRISGNFIHHIVGKDYGYGVVSGYGAFPLIERNTAYQNRHSIADNGDGDSGYVATDNYVLQQGPDYGFAGYDHTANFDVHGTAGLDCKTHTGGNASDYVEILYNTFLSGDRQNISIRGVPCRQSLVDGNIFNDGKSFTNLSVGIAGHSCTYATYGAVVVDNADGIPDASNPGVTVTSNNLYDQPAQVDQIAIGDFDGDGIDDIFTTTGIGWYYSSGGKSEWRWLRRATEKVSGLRLGDLDGDGRTDVIRATATTIDVSWGGVSGWQTLTATPAALPIGSYAIGNFDGDRLHGDDIFASDGTTWYLAKNGHDFAPVGASKIAPSQLRFGDFDGDGRTDVFTITSQGWRYSSAAVTLWQPIPGAPNTGSISTFLVGDFDGDGKTDIGRYYSQLTGPTTSVWKFDYSPGARAPFTYARTTNTAAQWAGHFADGPGVIWWDGDEFDLGTGTLPAARLSRQKMQ